MTLAQDSCTGAAPQSPDREVITAQVRAAGSSFYWAMRFQDQTKRDALFAVYAFCREVDDIADGTLSDDDKRAALEAWRMRIQALYDGRPDDAITRMLHEAIQAYRLKQQDFLAVIDGMEMDGVGPIRAPSMEELLLYCDRVACAVGRLCVHIFGEPGPAGQATADHLGLALQLTNILRDVAEDADMGRLYLPHELLNAEGITSTDPKTVLTDPSLPAVCRTLAQRAQDEFSAAEQAIAQCSRKAMRPAIIMMKVYQKTLTQLMAEDWSYLASGKAGVSLSKPEKLWIALRYGAF